MAEDVAVDTVHRFRFVGSGAEYFRIWIVNLALSIVTLGIYSAWATVRNRRYLYGNTQLAGDSFEYLAEPLQILKGRVIAVALLLLYSFGPLAIQGVVGLLLLAFIPWLIVRSLRFRAVMSRWRGVRFGFTGPTADAYKVWLLYALALIFTLGLALPWAQWLMSRFKVSGHRFGRSTFSFHARVSQYYKIYAIAGLVFISLAVLVAALLPAAGAAMSDERRQQLQGRVIAETVELVVEAEQAGEEVTPQRRRELREQAMLIALTEDERAELQAANAAMVQGLGLVVMALAVVAYFVWSLVSTLFMNLNYSSTRIDDDVRLDSRVPVWGMFWITLSNTVLILASLGLLLPWATCRRLRYRFSFLGMHTERDLDTFVAAEADRASAMGDEIGDAFDIDIGI